jgi:hypothetical protein
MNDNRIIGRAIEDRLTHCGVDSFDHAWTEEQAFRAAARRSPDLVIAGDTIACGSPFKAAQDIATWHDASVLTISAGLCLVQRKRGRAPSLQQTFPLTEIGAAVAVARSAA